MCIGLSMYSYLVTLTELSLHFNYILLTIIFYCLHPGDFGIRVKGFMFISLASLNKPCCGILKWAVIATLHMVQSRLIMMVTFYVLSDLLIIHNCSAT
jgi:hypothetical protein